MSEKDAKLQLINALRKCWAKSTSFNPKKWTKNNPAYGQCAVTAVVVQDFFGGKLIRCSVYGEERVSHYYNGLPDDKRIDLTRGQFKEGTRFSKPQYRERSQVLSYATTAKKYALLKKRVLQELKNRKNSTFSNQNLKGDTKPAHTV